MLSIILNSLFVLLLILVLVLVAIDKRKKRKLESMPKASFVVPCYNDSDSIARTIKSIYDVAGRGADVIVINDGSKDNSKAVLDSLSGKYPFKLINHPVNIGKAETLNRHFADAKHDIIFFVDSDVVVNKKSFIDSLARLQDKNVGAVSCPYTPNNKGALPLMQRIEYNMTALAQGSYNLFSCISLWGGFIAIKKKAFIEAGKFSLNAITEDMDLASKLNEKGWRVEQSFFPVKTDAPAKLSPWFKQKIRWSSGVMQCLLTHFKVWMKHPLIILFLVSYTLLMTFAVISMLNGLLLWHNMIEYFKFVHETASLLVGLKLTGLLYGVLIIKDLIWLLAFTFLSAPYVLPLITSFKKSYKIFLVVPFSIIYIPVYALVSTLGILYFLLFKIKLLNKKNRAW